MALPRLCPEILTLPVDAPVDYEWNDWDALAYFDYADTDLFARLERLTGKANIALALAVCEWILRRFAGIEPLEDASEYVEAGWAALLDPEYSGWIELDYEDNPGPVLRPQVIVMGIVNDAFYENDDDPEMAWRPCYAVNLARYVLPDGTAFEDWLESGISRLERFHTWEIEGHGDDLFAEEIYQGRPVAREIFDATFPYRPEEAEMLLHRLIGQIDPGNEFLNLPGA
ncbi:MAG: hypothetical protein N2422_00605 [Rhodobacteraceae bacterium]|nr:hypothetical protein [Paracoccaceae bacterium]